LTHKEAKARRDHHLGRALNFQHLFASHRAVFQGGLFLQTLPPNDAGHSFVTVRGEPTGPPKPWRFAIFLVESSIFMNALWPIAILALWVMVLFLGFLLWGALRAVALLRWRLEQLEATTPRRLGRSGLRPGKKAPEFTLPNIAGGEVGLQQYAGQQLLLVFMQPGCGPCHQVTPELNRLHEARNVQVLVIQNGTSDAIQKWLKESRPTFPVALQERFNVSKRYEVFATPFAFLIDEHGVIASRGIVSTNQYLGFVLSRAGHDEKEGDGEVEESERSQSSTPDADESSFANSKEVNHV
jgi:methylamine dehydrogenase accessory protein MauD